MLSLTYSFEPYSYLPGLIRGTYSKEEPIEKMISQDGHSIFSKNSRTIQEYFKNILLLFKNTIKRPEK